MKNYVFALILAAASFANAEPELWRPPWITKLIAVAFYPDGRTGCVVGTLPSGYSTPVVFRCTSDGGASWKDIFQESALRAEQADIVLNADSVHGWALITDYMEEGQTLLRTQDGTRTWTSSHLPYARNGGFLNSIRFAADARHGIVSGPGDAFRTEDGGMTWVPIDFGRVIDYTQAPVIHNPNGKDVLLEEMSGSYPEMRRVYAISSDGGSTWQPLEEWKTVPLIHPSGRVDFQQNPVSHAVLRSVDGITWQTVSNLSPDLYAENFFSRDGREVWLCGRDGLLLHSTDGGVTWNPIYQPPEWRHLDFNAAHAASDSSRFWAAGADGFVVRTMDGGTTWSGIQISPSKPALRAMYFLPDDLHGWVAGDGIISRTDDGGVTWQACEIEAGKEPSIFYALSFDTAGQRGWSGGKGNALWFTEDGGAHWKRAAVKAKNPSGEIHVIVPLTGSRILAFSEFEVLLSPDNGASWRSVTADDHLPGVPDHASGGVFLVGSADGCLALGAVYCSRDGGSTWNQAMLRDIHTNRPRTLNLSSTVAIDMDLSGRTAILNEVNEDETGWMRTTDYGRHWFLISELLPEGHCIPAISGDGSVWGACSFGEFFRLRENALDGPAISAFEIGDDLKPKIQATGSALKPGDFGQFKSQGPPTGFITVRGRGIEFLNGHDERAFLLDKVGQVQKWNSEIFHDNEDYFFDLFVSDGWNVATASASKRFSSTPSEFKTLTEIDTTDFNFSGDTAPIDDIDGKPLSSEVVTRGPHGKPGSISKRVADSVDAGIHAITLAGQRALLYKDKTSLSLFHPFDHSYAVIVAIGDYPASSGFGKLRAGVDQGSKLKTELEQTGFEVFDPLYDSQATKSSIENLLTRRVLKRVTARDRLLIYLSGHGADRLGADGKPLGYFIPYDGRLDDLDATAINLFDIQKYARELPAKHILFALDSCQSGFALRDAPTLPPGELKEFKTVTQITGYTREPTRLILTAGTGPQKAVDDNGGVFTDKLMEAIRGGPAVDLDNNGVVDQWELCKYLSDNVPPAAKLLAGVTQEPGCQNLDGFGGGKWIFATTPQVRELLGAK